MLAMLKRWKGNGKVVRNYNCQVQIVWIHRDKSGRRGVKLGCRYYN